MTARDWLQVLAGIPVAIATVCALWGIAAMLGVA